MAASAQRVAPAHEGDLRGARALLGREVAVDELAVVDAGHEEIVAGGRDTSAVATLDEPICNFRCYVGPKGGRPQAFVRAPRGTEDRPRATVLGLDVTSVGTDSAPAARLPPHESRRNFRCYKCRLR